VEFLLLVTIISIDRAEHRIAPQKAADGSICEDCGYVYV